MELVEFEDTEKYSDVPKYQIITLDRLVNNCAKDNAEISRLKNEFQSCHKVLVKSCSEFEIVFQCLEDLQHENCHLFDIHAFETDLHAHLIENYEDSTFSIECDALNKLHGNIFHTSTKLCSKSYIDIQKIQKQECSTMEEQKMTLQIKFQTR